MFKVGTALGHRANTNCSAHGLTRLTQAREEVWGAAVHAAVARGRSLQQLLARRRRTPAVTCPVVSLVPQGLAGDRLRRALNLACR